MILDSARDLNLTLKDIESFPPKTLFKRIAETTRIEIHDQDDWANAGRLLDHARELADGRVTLVGFPSGWRCYLGAMEQPIRTEADAAWMPRGASAVEAICRAALCRMANVDPARPELIPSADPRR